MKINKIIGRTVEVVCIVGLSTLISLGVNLKTESYVKNEVVKVVNEVKNDIEEIKKDMNNHNTCNENKSEVASDEVDNIVGAVNDTYTKKDIHKEDKTTNNKPIKKPTISENVNVPDDKYENNTNISDDTNTSNDNNLNQNETEHLEEDKVENIHFTEDDIKRYEEYKESLINEYGEEVYNLMNQEAGIENEEQSFYHFMKYGI